MAGLDRLGPRTRAEGLGWRGPLRPQAVAAGGLLVRQPPGESASAAAGLRYHGAGALRHAPQRGAARLVALHVAPRVSGGGVVAAQLSEHAHLLDLAKEGVCVGGRVTQHPLRAVQQRQVECCQYADVYDTAVLQVPVAPKVNRWLQRLATHAVAT